MFHISKVFLLTKNKQNSFLSYCYLFFLYHNIAFHNNNNYIIAHSLINTKNPLKVFIHYYPSLNKHINRMTISDSTSVNNNNNNPTVNVDDDNNNNPIIPIIAVNNNNPTTTANNSDIIINKSNNNNNNKVLFTNQVSKQKNKAKSRGQENPDYKIIIDNSGRSIRAVKPYIQEFVTFCKGRWIGREIVEVLTSD